LADFEARPLRSVVDDYDVVVLDHPGLGEAVADHCLVELDEVFPAGELEELCRLAVGPSSRSYNLGYKQWAMPIDAATQVSVVRPDLVTARPLDWETVLGLASKVPTALCLGGPHAFLMFAAICLALGTEPARHEEVFVRRTAGLEALKIMKTLLDDSEPWASSLSPVQLLELMAHDDDVAYCPLVYGYLPYQLGRPGAHRLDFFDAPAGHVGAPPASVLGGAGLAVTRSCTDLDLVGELIRRLSSEQVQRNVYLEEGAQSALASVWDDPGVARATSGFFSNTRLTIEHAWIRPRFDGYPLFQTEASAAVRTGLFTGELPGRTLDVVDKLYRTSLSARRGNE
jgi:multiple sugar transport system substrate-binding protein